MKKVLDKNAFFGELNLNNLPNDKKQQIWAKFLEVVSLEILDKVLDQLPEKRQKELFLNLVKNGNKVEEFLAKNPKLVKITKEAVLKVKRKIQKNKK